jgi:hypothetical protein
LVSGQILADSLDPRSLFYTNRQVPAMIAGRPRGRCDVRGPRFFWAILSASKSPYPTILDRLPVFLFMEASFHDFSTTAPTLRGYFA